MWEKKKLQNNRNQTCKLKIARKRRRPQRLFIMITLVTDAALTYEDVTTTPLGQNSHSRKKISIGKKKKKDKKQIAMSNFKVCWEKESEENGTLVKPIDGKPDFVFPPFSHGWLGGRRTHMQHVQPVVVWANSEEVLRWSKRSSCPPTPERIK